MGREEEMATAIQRVLGCKPNDHFAVLALDVAECAVEDVKATYKRMVLLLHPDKCKLPKAADAFAAAEKAYRTLNDDAVLRRFKVAHQRKLEAEKKKAAGGAKAEEDRETVQKRDREERYLEALRLQKERDTKKRKMEAEAKADARLATDLTSQRSDWEQLRSMTGLRRPAAGKPAAR